MSMPPLNLAAQRIALFEGFRAKPYLDSAATWTIGYGTIRYPDGLAVTPHDNEVTPADGLVFLQRDLTATANLLWRALTKQPTINQWSAMLSLAYNIGASAICNSSVVRFFNAGQIQEAADAFLSWDKAHVDGKLVEIAGLLNRRQAERSLFLAPDEVLGTSA